MPKATTIIDDRLGINKKPFIGFCLAKAYGIGTKVADIKINTENRCK